MRKELQVIEQVEQYLEGNLSLTERANFESRLSQSTTLQSQVTFQKGLIEGVERIALRLDTKMAYKRYLLKKWFVISSIALLIIAAAITATYYFTNQVIDPETELAQSISPIESEMPKNMNPIVAEELTDSSNLEVFKSDDLIIFADSVAEVEMPINPQLSENDSQDNTIETEVTADFAIERLKEPPLEVDLLEADPILRAQDSMLSQELVDSITNQMTGDKSADVVSNAAFRNEKLKGDAVSDRNRLELTAPSAFSPDGDGMNDYYLIRQEEEFKVFEISITDNRGKEIYKSSDQNFKWDGTDLKGKKAPPGSYNGTIYAVDEEDRAYEVKVGVILIRNAGM